MAPIVVAALLALSLFPSAPAADAPQAGKEAPAAAPTPTLAPTVDAPAAVPSAPRADAPAKASPAADRVARALTTQPNWNETIGSYATSLSTQISAAVKSQGGEQPANVEQRVRKGLDSAVGYDEVVRLQAQALAGRFSEDELRTIQKFYESGPGKKLVSELPAISRQVIEVVQQRISAAIPRIIEEVAPSLARAKPGSEGEGGAQGRKPPESPTPPRR